MTADREGLPSWTIYDHPTDFPDCYVARRFIWDKPTAEIITSPTLEALQQHFILQGLVCMQRHPNDDPKIVETWM